MQSAPVLMQARAIDLQFKEEQCYKKTNPRSGVCWRLLHVGLNCEARKVTVKQYFACVCKRAAVVR